MNAPGTVSRAVALTLATLVLALSATMAFATAWDYDQRALVPPGVSVRGVDLSGMSRSQARTAIERAVTAPLLAPVPVDAGGQVFRFDPRGAVRVDSREMLDEAYAPLAAASLLSRIGDRLAGASRPVEIAPRFTVDEAALDAWIDSVADRVERRAVDATVTIAGGAVRVQPSQEGLRVDRERGAEALRAAFRAESVFGGTRRAVTVPVDILVPQVTEERFDTTVLVDLSERRIRLFNGAKLKKEYRCAIGTPGFPTPQGEFEIVRKRYMPTWVNPAPNGWGADMPAMIPPGPGNPLGTRALNLSAPGIRFHGTTKIGSIGTAASHGCMRMLRRDIEDLYERVDVGTKVFIAP